MTSAVGSSMMSSQAYLSTKSSNLSKMVDDLFTKADTDSNGSIDKTELQAVFDQVASSDATSETSSSTASVDEIFKAFDSNSDNLLTKQEMTEGLQRLAAEFESQFGNVNVGSMPPPPPPPPPASGGTDDSDGLSKTELTAAADEASQSGSPLASSLNQLVESFDEADTNQDGKVSIQEAMAFQAKMDSSSATSDTSSSTSTASASDTSSSTSASSSSQDDASSSVIFMKRIGQLLLAYGGINQDFGLSDSTTSLSVMA